MKGPVVDWITPQGESLKPPLNRRHKVDRGYGHEATGKLLCPAHLHWEDEVTRIGLRSGKLIVPGHSWPMFLFENSLYYPNDPWKGLLQSVLMVK
ncbi:hypothetical protein DXG01_015550, partial [Tephrocybe rancida]